MATKPRMERSLLFPNKEFREKCEKPLKIGVFDPNRHLSSPPAKTRSEGAITMNP